MLTCASSCRGEGMLLRKCFARTHSVVKGVWALLLTLRIARNRFKQAALLAWHRDMEHAKLVCVTVRTGSATSNVPLRLTGYNLPTAPKVTVFNETHQAYLRDP